MTLAFTVTSVLGRLDREIHPFDFVTRPNRRDSIGLLKSLVVEIPSYDVSASVSARSGAR